MNKGADLKILLQGKIEICRDLEALLNEILEHKRGSVWGEEQVSKLNVYFSRLHKLDRLAGHISVPGIPDAQEAQLPVLVRDLERRMSRLKRLIGQFQARLTGGRQAISARLKDLLAGRGIKGYQRKTGKALNSGELIG